MEFEVSRGAIKAVGERGSWFAKVNGERLPCVHQQWVKGKIHLDPNYDAENPKYVELVAAIQHLKRVVLTKDKIVENAPNKSGIGFERAGYIAVFDVDDVNTGPEGLRFDLLNRVCDLK